MGSGMMKWFFFRYDRTHLQWYMEAILEYSFKTYFGKLQ